MGTYQGKPRGGYSAPTAAQMRNRAEWHRETARVNKINEILDRMPKRPTPSEIFEANKDVTCNTSNGSSSLGGEILETVAAAVVVSFISKAWDHFFNKPKPMPVEKPQFTDNLNARRFVANAHLIPEYSPLISPELKAYIKNRSLSSLSPVRKPL